MKEIVLYNNDIIFENLNKDNNIIVTEEIFENKINDINKSDNYKMKSSNSFHTASSTASMESIKKKKKKKNIKNDSNDNINNQPIENEINLCKLNNLKEEKFSFDKKDLKNHNGKVKVKGGNLNNKNTILKKLEYEKNNDLNIIYKKTKSFNFQTNLKKKKKKNNNNKAITSGLKTIHSEIWDLRFDNNTFNEKRENNLLINLFNTSASDEIKKEDILLQYEKYKRKKKRKKKIKYRLFKKSVCYSNYISPDVLNMLNQTKLNLTFYQREVDDFLNVIRNLQNIVLIEREKYNELKDMLKYTTEEIEKENNKLYEELNVYKSKYKKLKNLISNIGYGIFFNLDNKEIYHKYNDKVNTYMNFENSYINEEGNEHDYVMVNTKLSSVDENFDNKYIKKSKNNNHSLLKYLDF